MLYSENSERSSEEDTNTFTVGLVLWIVQLRVDRVAQGVKKGLRNRHSLLRVSVR